MNAMASSEPTLSSNVISLGSSLSWVTRISRTRVSTVAGFSLSTNAIDGQHDYTLEDVLRIVQHLGIKRCPIDGLSIQTEVGEGETFKVTKCKYQGKMVAVKALKLDKAAASSSALTRRLKSVLQEMCIMNHDPLAKHPTILSILGYGWQSKDGTPLPYVVVELGVQGSLRLWLATRPKVNFEASFYAAGRPLTPLASLRFKMLLVGDIAAGLMALHRCGIVHGDLKLDNIVVFDSPDRTRIATAKLADFGHSIILSSAEATSKTYYGTVLYNAPEVFTQRKNSIPPTQLTKCDVWAFGLLVWETLANGDRYFEERWRLDPQYARQNVKSQTVLASSNLEKLSRAMESFSVETSVPEEVEELELLGTFDHQFLRSLAKQFLKSYSCPGGDFEKSFLRPLFDRALEPDPEKRIGDLGRMPFMKSWGEFGTTSLEARLAMHTSSNDLSFAIFSQSRESQIPWSEQKGILQDLCRIGDWGQGGVPAANAAYQAGMCYILQFGTDRDLAKAKEYLEKAATLRHPLATIFNPRIFKPRISSALQTEPAKQPYNASSYAFLLAGLVQQKDFKHSARDYPPVYRWSATEGDQIQNLTPADAPVHETEEDSTQGVDILSTISGLPETHVSERKHIDKLRDLDLAVSCDNASFVEVTCQQLTPHELDQIGRNGETFAMHACRRGKAEIVATLLKHGAHPDASTADGGTLFHWLFCIEKDLDSVRTILVSSKFSKFGSIDRICTKNYEVHQQWPTRLAGSPLAYAIAANSLPTVRLLLELGADPLAPAFMPEDNELSLPWTPLHLMIKYHAADMLALVKPLLSTENFRRNGREHPNSASKEHSRALSQDSRGVKKLEEMGFACVLGCLSLLERFVIHGSHYRNRLSEIVSWLPKIWIETATPDGQTALFQAIDLDNLDVAETLLKHHPSLAKEKFQDPEDPNEFTWPMHFAAQLANRKDIPSVTHMMDLILRYDEMAVHRVDSIGQTPLHMAVQGTYDRPLIWLLQRGAFHEIGDKLGRVPMHLAREVSHVRTLRADGASLYTSDKEGRSIAHYAVIEDRQEIMAELLEERRLLSATSLNHGKPIDCAIKLSRKAITHILLETQLDIYQQGGDVYSPLAVAILNGTASMIHLLKDTPLFRPDDYRHDVITAFLKLPNDGLFDMMLYTLWKRLSDYQWTAIWHQCVWLGDKTFQRVVTVLNRIADTMSLHVMKNWTSVMEQIPSTRDNKALPFTPAGNDIPVHTAARYLRYKSTEYYLSNTIYSRVDIRDCLYISETETIKDSQSCSRGAMDAMLSGALHGKGYPFESNLEDTKTDLSSENFESLTAGIHMNSVAINDLYLLPGLWAQCVDGELVEKALSKGEIGFVAGLIRRNLIDASYFMQHNAKGRRRNWCHIAGFVKIYLAASVYNFKLLAWVFRDDFIPVTEFKKNEYDAIFEEDVNYDFEWDTVYEHVAGTMAIAEYVNRWQAPWFDNYLQSILIFKQEYEEFGMPNFLACLWDVNKNFWNGELALNSEPSKLASQMPKIHEEISIKEALYPSKFDQVIKVIQKPDPALQVSIESSPQGWNSEVGHQETLANSRFQGFAWYSGRLQRFTIAAYA